MDVNVIGLTMKNRYKQMQKIKDIIKFVVMRKYYVLSFLIFGFVSCSTNSNKNTVKIVQDSLSVVENSSVVNNDVSEKNDADTIIWNLLTPNKVKGNFTFYE